MSTTNGRNWTTWALWLPGAFVALGAGAATAHGLYETATAAGVPAGLAWLYPVITDGLALVAYVSTARLADGGRAYAWAVVVLAAGLSGIAQAAYLAGGVGSASSALRFGVGAWPALAAAIVAHLLFLLGTHTHDGSEVQRASELVHRPALEPTGTPGVQPSVQASVVRDVQQLTPAALAKTDEGRSTGRRSVTEDGAAVTPARDRARSAARRHASLHGSLPTVSQLQSLADVARGTASTALKELRDKPARLHVVNDTDKEISNP